MNIRGLVKFSLIDYPGKMSCIIFVGDCNFRCPYCHNPHLVFDPESQPQISDEEIFAFLENRKNKLDGVVISGGEPSLQPDLMDFVSKIKDMGFLVKVDTNCTRSDLIVEGINNQVINSLGIDYKAPVDSYNKIAYSNTPDIGNRVQKVIKSAIKNEITIDIRTTIHKELLSLQDLKDIRKELNFLGVDEWTIQQFNPVDIIDDELLEKETYTDRQLLGLASILGGKTRVRGLAGKILVRDEKVSSRQFPVSG
jgi:pyruvate formate lyase activating enzyme